METRKAKTKVVAAVLALAALCVFSLFAVGGNLEPSAPPGPTMKTLDEIEPRIPIQSLPGDSNSLYVISQPGSYYLTGNITGEPNKCGIMIATNNVTLDLMGFGLIGVPGSQDGICVQYHETDEPLPIEEVSFNFSIRNGTICNWSGNGIDAYDMFLMIEGGVVEGKILVHSNSELLNISAHSNDESGFCGRNCYTHMEDVSFCNNGGSGVNAYDAYLTIEGIDAHKNDGHGLCVDGNSFCHMEDVSFTYNVGNGMHILGMMTNVDAYSGYASHNGGNGMYVKVDGEASIHMEDMSLTRNDANGVVVDGNSFCHMEDVSFAYNGGHGVLVHGMLDAFGVLAPHNGGHGVFVYGMLDAFGVLAPHNGGGGIIVGGSGNLNQCTVVGNGGSGIEAGIGSTVRNCTARGNTGDGIVVSSKCQVVGNTCEGNGVGVIGAAEPAGIRATGVANRIESNHVIGNNVGIDIDAAGNLIISNSATGNTTNYIIAPNNTAGPLVGSSDIVSSNNPHANYEY